MKKLHAIAILSTFYAFLIRTDQENPYQSSSSPTITVTINAPTSSDLGQNNNVEQNARHASQPTTQITTNINSENSKPQHKDLKPDVSAVTYMARNGAKLAVIVRVATWYPAFGAAYLINRAIIQPLLGNGDILETISEQEQEEYAKKGLRKVADIRFFPILHSMKKYLKP